MVIGDNRRLKHYHTASYIVKIHHTSGLCWTCFKNTCGKHRHYKNGRSQLHYKLIRHRLATCNLFHAFHPRLVSTKRWLVVPPSDMLIVYKMNLWFCKNMIKIYSLQNACYLQNAMLNITLTVQNSTLQTFCRQLKFTHSVGEIVRGIYMYIYICIYIYMYIYIYVYIYIWGLC